MPLPFGGWTLEQVREVVDAAQSDNAATNKLFMEGDHWQGGKGWKGPRPDQGDAEHDETMALIEAGFCSENAIKEVVERHAAGALGREPVWGFTPLRALKTGEKPNDAEQVLIDEVEALMTSWWNEKKAHGTLREALEKALWAKHGPVRCFIPQGRLQTWTTKGTLEDGTPTNVPRAGLKLQRGDMAAALKHIFIESPDPLDSVVYKDPATQVEVGITKYEVLEDEADPDSDTIEVFEMVWVDDETGETQFRVLDEDGGDSTVSFNLSGHRTIMAIERPELVTDQVIQNQKALNTAITLTLSNLGDVSYLERTFLNARMPGYEEEYLDPVTNTKRKRWVRESFMTGPGAVNFVKGEEVDNPDGTTTLTTPQLIHKPPTSLEPIINTAEFYSVLILRETRQTHILKNEEGRASGKSHEQARVDYNISLGASKDPAEQVGRSALEAVVAWAELIAGVAGKYTSQLRAVFECQMDLGPVSQDERTQNREDVEAGLMDDETAMARAGILDVDKTKAIIASRPEARLQQMEKLAGVSQKLGNKLPLSVLAAMAKFSPEEVAALEKAEKEAQAREEKMAKEKAAAEAEKLRSTPIGGRPTAPRGSRGVPPSNTAAA